MHDVPDPQPGVEIYMPDELEPGAYANALLPWHTAHEFTLDFAALQRPAEDESGSLVVRARVVTRVKIAATVIFDVIRVLNEDMTTYERRYGEIRNPEDDR